MEIKIVVFDGVDELDVFGPFGVLSMAGFDVELVAVEQPGLVTSRGGVKLQVSNALDKADGIVVPGGGWLNRASEGALAQARITAGALTAGIDLGLWITKRELGAATADRVAAAIDHPAPR